MTIATLKRQIHQQSVQMNACRQEMKHRIANVQQAVASPAVLCGGVISGFLCGYFFIARPAVAPVAAGAQKPSVLDNLNAFLSSPLFLLATSLLKDDIK